MKETTKGRRPLEVIGWLSTAGCQTIIHKAEREAARANTGKPQRRGPRTKPPIERFQAHVKP